MMIKSYFISHYLPRTNQHFTLAHFFNFMNRYLLNLFHCLSIIIRLFSCLIRFLTLNLRCRINHQFMINHRSPPIGRYLNLLIFLILLMHLTHRLIYLHLQFILIHSPLSKFQSSLFIYSIFLSLKGLKIRLQSNPALSN